MKSGTCPSLKPRRELVFEVFRQVYERTSLIGTTNVQYEACLDALDSEHLPGALLDRLTTRVYNLEVSGEIYRIIDTTKRLK